MWSNRPVAQGSQTNPGETWRVLQCPFLIECSSPVLDQIRRDVESALRSPRGEREAGGVLYGLNEPESIRILACRPLPCEHAMGPGFVLSARDEKRLAELIAAPAADPELHGLAALGWYHSHIHSRIFLSERDLQIHSRYFPAPFQVALVLRPGTDRPLRAGYFFWEPGGGIHADSSYQEFALKSPPPEPALRRPAPSRQPPQSTPLAEPVCRKCGGKRLRRSHRGLVERLWVLAGIYPFRCEECLSRSLHRRSRGLLELAHPHAGKRPEERKRAWLRTRREILLYGGGVLGFLLFLFYLIRDAGPKPDQP